MVGFMQKYLVLWNMEVETWIGLNNHDCEEYIWADFEVGLGKF